jgi:hypothetical protein
MYVPFLFNPLTSPDDQVPIDQAAYTTTNRSPSPLFEVDETSSPELTELQQPRRRASESLSSTPRDGHSSKRRGFSLSIPQDRSRLDPDEKANRAAAAEGLSKGDKRRMQNKLAQRAFRARSKIVNKHVRTSFLLLVIHFHFLIPYHDDGYRLISRRLVDWKIWKNLPNNNPHVLDT